MRIRYWIFDKTWKETTQNNYNNFNGTKTETGWQTPYWYSIMSSLH